MLGSDDRLDDIGEVVHIGESLDTKNYIVKGSLLVGGLLRGLNDCSRVSKETAMRERRYIPYLGLNRSLPKSLDLSKGSMSAALGVFQDSYLKEMPY